MMREQWIKLLKENESVMKALVKEFYPTIGKPCEFDRVPISAPAAELARLGVLEGIEPGIQPLEEFDRYIRESNWIIVHEMLLKVWFGIPESRELVESLNGFGTLCDLCSEFEYTEEEINDYREKE